MSKRPKIKICGITSREDALAIARLGVEYLGFVIDYPKSPRSMSPDQVAEIIQVVKRKYPAIQCVGVFVDQPVQDIKEAVQRTGLDVVQLHGNESVEDCHMLRDVAIVCKAIIVKEEDDVHKADTYKEVVDYVLFDAGQGSGRQISVDFIKDKKIDMLAGGLGPENVREIFDQLQPDMLDLNSGVEFAPGKKDITKVGQAIQAVRSKLFDSTSFGADQHGYFGEFGGSYVPELLRPALDQLTQVYQEVRQDPLFEQELMDLYRNYSGRPTPLYFAKNLTEQLGGAKIYIKNEGLNHTGAHKINHCLGQALLAKRMGKKRLIAETGAGQHGLATATVAAKFGFECTVYMGAVDVERQRPNVFFMEQLGATVVPVEYGTQRLKDAVMAALQDWIEYTNDSYYLLGSALGPHPYPSMVRDFQTIVGLEVKDQITESEGQSPDYMVACVGGGSNAIGFFTPFLEDQSVQMIGVEAGGTGNQIGQHATRLNGGGAVGVVEGYKSYFLQDDDGQVAPTHSVSAGLDYAGIGPQHALLFDQGRVTYRSVNDQDVLSAVQTLAKTEGIISALESAHAVAEAIRLAPTLPKDKIVVANLSGRGDKDLFILGDAFGGQEWRDFLKQQGGMYK